MPPIGETLREARMRQRLDIVDVEARTKIRAKYLRALENEEFSMLPGPTFVKTFLRTYAEELGLDPHLLVEEYRVGHEERDELDFQPLTPGKPVRDGGRERRPPRGPPSRGLVFGGFVLALLVFLIVLGVTGEDEQPERAATETTRRPAARPKPKPKSKPKPAPRVATVSIRPVDATYMCVDRGENTDVVFAGITDQPRTFRGRRLRLNMGKRSPVLRLNGKRVNFEQGPAPIGFEFTPTHSKELAEGERPTCG